MTREEADELLNKDERFADHFIELCDDTYMDSIERDHLFLLNRRQNTIVLGAAVPSSQRERLMMFGTRQVLLTAAIVVPMLSTIARGQNPEESLKHIGDAIWDYEAQHDQFPPPYSVDAEGNKLHSWRVLILPFLGERERQLYESIDLDRPWNSPVNLKFANSMPTVFRGAKEPDDGVPITMTPFLAVTGTNAFWSNENPRQVRELTDGLSRTAMLICSPEHAVEWMSPNDPNLREALRWTPTLVLRATLDVVPHKKPLTFERYRRLLTINDEKGPRGGVLPVDKTNCDDDQR